MTTSLPTPSPSPSTPSSPSIDARIVIVGGGIGGLAAALALTGIGCRVTVLEKAAQFGEVGAGVQLGPNATRILRDWGLLDGLLAGGVAPEHLVFKDATTGAELTRQDLTGEFADRYGSPYVVVHRSDLHAALENACRQAGVDLHTGSAVVDARTIKTDTTADGAKDTDGAEVTLADGEILAADVVIAADGLRSFLREQLVGDRPVPSGYVAYRGTVPIDAVPDGSALRDVVAWLGPQCHFVQYPLRQGEMLNQVAVFRSPSFDAGNPEWGGPEELDAAFADCTPEIREALAFLWRDRRWQMCDREPTDAWVHGRIVLLGDAAHPPLQYLAQGACMAIEDSAALAAAALDFVTSLGPDKGWDQALLSYQAERAPRTARIQSTARVWGEIWHVDGVGRVLRNEVMSRRDTASFDYTDWLYGDQPV